MDFASRHRHFQASMNNSHALYYGDRNVPLAITNNTRSDPRIYPTNAAVGGPRMRGGLRQEDGNAEGGQSRRRIAIACARCRKRKIRCSGDPGNGTGCGNCRNAGIDPAACQFHRVGSDSLNTVLDSMHLAHSLTSIATPHTTIYGPHGLGYPRNVHPPFPQLSTKSANASAWAMSFSEETSPVETYAIDQPGAYLPQRDTMADPPPYTANYRWGQGGSRSYPGGTAAYLEHEPNTAYGDHGLPPYTPTAPITTSEALSPLNMTALHISLPIRTQTQPAHASDHPGLQRQLPMPYPSPAQASRNAVDQLQDQRLRSAQDMGRTSRTDSVAYSRYGLPFSSDCEVHVPPTTTASTSSLATQATVSATMPEHTDATLNLVPVTISAADTAPTSSTQGQVNFMPTSYLESMPVPAIATTYSNFRNYGLPTSSSVETMPAISRHDSQANLYHFSPDSDSKPHVAEPADDSALVSGHQYAPLKQNKAIRRPSLDQMRHHSFDTQVLSTHRTSNL